MARRPLIEDSDDDFPAVAQLLQVRKPASGRAPKSTTTTTTTSEELLQRKGEKIVRQGGDVSETRRIKPRKRILEPRGENPLLRRITAEEVGEEVVVRRRRTTTKYSMALEFEREEEEEEGISDFIVSDRSSLLEEEDDEEEEIVEKRPPRSARRLVKGRRPTREKSPSEDLELRMGKLMVGESVTPPGEQVLETMREILQRDGIGEGVGDQHEKKTALPKDEDKDYASLDVEEPLTLRFSPPRTKPRKVSKETRTRLITPPGSLERKSNGLTSPGKRAPRIPLTPYQPSTEAFWSQEVINDWNDEYSPRKEEKLRLKPQLDEDKDSSGGVLLSSPTKKSPVKQKKAAREAKREFSEKKHDIAKSFLAELDEKITDGQISKLCTATGGVKVVWSKKLCTTAGRANWKRETIKASGPNPDSKPPAPTYRHHASIELAEKVIDDEDRLLNVIAHEFCHLANFMISNVKTNPHGKEFKSWAAKCSRRFAHRGIEVTTKHSYAIDYKYVWECENCGLEYKRHSKSIDPIRHRCGMCKSKLVQTQPVPKKEGKVSEYQLYVKENMKRIREENPGSPQKEIMGLVARRYKEDKVAKMGENSGVAEDEGLSVESEKGDNAIKAVVRKLDFLDLTSP